MKSIWELKEELAFLNNTIEHILRIECRRKGLDPDKWDTYTMELTIISPLLKRKDLVQQAMKLHTPVKGGRGG